MFDMDRSRSSLCGGALAPHSGSLRLLTATTGLFWVSPATSVDLTLHRVVGAAMVYGVVVALGLKLVALKLGP